MKMLPKFFRHLFWSYDFSKVSPQKDIKEIIVNTINYGDWKHWRWIARYYGKEQIEVLMQRIPASEFRKAALKLAKILFEVGQLQYETRSDKIRAEKGHRTLKPT